MTAAYRVIRNGDHGDWALSEGVMPERKDELPHNEYYGVQEDLMQKHQLRSAINIPSITFLLKLMHIL